MRSLLPTTAIGALLSLGSAAVIANPYEEYEGTTVVVSWPALSHFQAAETLIEEFTEETGIEVEVDALQYLKLRDRQLLEISKDEGEYDVVSWVVMWKGEYVSKGLLTPLSQFFTNGALVDPQYDIDDIADAYLQNGGVVGGKKGYMPGKSGALYGIPSAPKPRFSLTARISSKSTASTCPAAMKSWSPSCRRSRKRPVSVP